MNTLLRMRRQGIATGAASMSSSPYSCADAMLTSISRRSSYRDYGGIPSMVRMSQFILAILGMFPQSLRELHLEMLWNR